MYLRAAAFSTTFLFYFKSLHLFTSPLLRHAHFPIVLLPIFVFHVYFIRPPSNSLNTCFYLHLQSIHHIVQEHSLVGISIVSNAVVYVLAEIDTLP
jgi:hypothetical protein